jgi:hypothetical protein
VAMLQRGVSSNVLNHSNHYIEPEMLFCHLGNVETHDGVPQACTDPLLIERSVLGSAVEDADKLAYPSMHLTGRSNSRHTSTKPSCC